jgi:hypothetical protein
MNTTLFEKANSVDAAFHDAYRVLRAVRGKARKLARRASSSISHLLDVEPHRCRRHAAYPDGLCEGEPIDYCQQPLETALAGLTSPQRRRVLRTLTRG